MSPMCAMPATSVENTSGAMIILIRRRNSAVTMLRYSAILLQLLGALRAPVVDRCVDCPAGDDAERQRQQDETRQFFRHIFSPSARPWTEAVAPPSVKRFGFTKTGTAGRRRMMSKGISLNALPDRYRLILCDIWGVIHDGFHLYPGAADRLRQLRSEGRTVVLITNAPRTTRGDRRALDSDSAFRRRLGRRSPRAVEAGIDALNAITEPVGFIGTDADRADSSRGAVWRSRRMKVRRAGRARASQPACEARRLSIDA